MTWKRRLIQIGVAGLALAILVAVLLWRPQRDSGSSASGDLWTCSMHPQIRLPNPGNCPICGMKLIPVSQLPGAKEDLEQRAGLETEAIRHRDLFKEVRTVGKFDYSERQVAFISSRIAGRVDRVFADFTGLNVKRGDHLVEIYSPDLNVTQSELLIALEAHEKEKPAASGTRSFTESRLESARTKLRLLGILDEQIRQIEESRKTTTHLTIYAPIGGTVIEKDVREGQYVDAGEQLYRIANFDPIWLYLNIYEYDVAWVRFGQPVEVAVEAYAGETFRGTVTFIDPFLDDATRTIRVRVNLPNADRRLKPQMFATATIRVPLQADGAPEPTGLEGQYICPMHPEIIQAEPGECPLCEMPLERVPEVPAPSKSSSSVSTELDRDATHADHAAHKQDTEEPEQSSSPAKPAPDKAAHQDHADEGEENATHSGELAVPVSAVLDTGRRRVAFRLTKEGAYELVDLKLGPRAQAADSEGRRRDYYLVLDGLQEGDKVVVRSGFLLDSQRQIEGMPSLLYPTGQAASMSGHSGHGGHQNAGGTTPAKSSPSGHQH